MSSRWELLKNQEKQKKKSVASWVFYIHKILKITSWISCYVTVLSAELLQSMLLLPVKLHYFLCLGLLRIFSCHMHHMFLFSVMHYHQLQKPQVIFFFLKQVWENHCPENEKHECLNDALNLEWVPLEWWAAHDWHHLIRMIVNDTGRGGMAFYLLRSTAFSASKGTGKGEKMQDGGGKKRK